MTNYAPVGVYSILIVYWQATIRYICSDLIEIDRLIQNLCVDPSAHDCTFTLCDCLVWTFDSDRDSDLNLHRYLLILLKKVMLVVECFNIIDQVCKKANKTIIKIIAKFFLSPIIPVFKQIFYVTLFYSPISQEASKKHNTLEIDGQVFKCTLAVINTKQKVFFSGHTQKLTSTRLIASGIFFYSSLENTLINLYNESSYKYSFFFSFGCTLQFSQSQLAFSHDTISLRARAFIGGIHCKTMNIIFSLFATEDIFY